MTDDEFKTAMLETVRGVTRDTQFRTDVLTSLQDIARKQDRLRDEVIERIEKIEAFVFPSDPPPPNAPSLVKRITHNEGETAEVTGRLMRVEAILERQNKAAGIAPADSPMLAKLRTFVFSREAANLAIRLATLAGIAYAAAHGVPMTDHAPALPPAAVGR